MRRFSAELEDKEYNCWSWWSVRAEGIARRAVENTASNVSRSQYFQAKLDHESPGDSWKLLHEFEKAAARTFYPNSIYRYFIRSTTDVVVMRPVLLGGGC